MISNISLTFYIIEYLSKIVLHHQQTIFGLKINFLENHCWKIIWSIRKTIMVGEYILDELLSLHVAMENSDRLKSLFD